MKSKKNKTKRKGSNNRASITMVGLLGGYSDRSRVTLRYVSEFGLTTATVAATSYVFTGNDVYDPDVTGAGSQPANFDDFAAVYLRYRVWRSKITVAYTAEPDTACDGFRLVVGPRHTSTNITTHATQNDFMAQPYSRTHIWNYYIAGMSTEYHSPWMSTQKFLGLSDVEFEGQDDLTALCTTSPAHRWFWHVNQSNANTANVDNAAFYTVIVEYDVEFWDRVDTTLDLDAKIQRLLVLKSAKANLTDEGSQPGDYVSVNPTDFKMGTREHDEPDTGGPVKGVALLQTPVMPRHTREEKSCTRGPQLGPDRDHSLESKKAKRG